MKNAPVWLLYEQGLLRSDLFPQSLAKVELPGAANQGFNMLFK